MNKQSFYSLAAVCKMLKIEPHTLRYWERQFEFHFKRNSAGRRIISREQLEKLKLIQHLLHREKMTIKGAKRKLAAMITRTEQLPDPKNTRQILLWLKRELISLRTALETGKDV